MKLKPGQKVKVVASTYNPEEQTRAMVGKVCEVKNYDNRDNTYRVWTEDKSDYWWFNESDLQPLEKTWDTLEAGDWDTLEAGDVLVHSSGQASVVQGVIGEIVFSTFNTGNEDDEFAGYGSKLQLQRHGYTIKQAEPEPATIEINGKKYKKDEVTERLSELEPID